MMIFLSLTIYILLIFILSIKEKEIELTDFEIQRRIDLGEKRFVKLSIKKQFVPLFNRFRNFVSVFLAVVLALSNSQILKFTEATIITFGMLFLAFMLSRVDFMKKFSHRFFEKITPYFYIFWNNLSAKNRKRILKFRHKTGWKFYSKEEMFDFLANHKTILYENELKWFERISALSSKKITDIMVNFEDLDILHEKDLLTPLVIDELFKSKQSVFAVMDPADTDVLGVVKMEAIGEISGDSKRVRTIMDREYFEIQSEKTALEAFEKMIKSSSDFAIVKNRNNQIVGTLYLSDLMKLKLLKKHS